MYKPFINLTIIVSFCSSNNGRVYILPGSIINMKKEAKNVGKAYGFFYYAGRTRHITEVLPQIREGTETPKELGLRVIEGVENLNVHGDSKLAAIVAQAKSQHMSHVIEATLPDMKNVRAANCLGNVMGGISQELYDSSEPFYAGITYKRGEQYVFRRK